MIVWTDLETTGLDERADGANVLEIAIIITDDDLNPIAEFQRVLRFDIDRFDQEFQMDDVVREMHTKSGLFDLCRPPHGAYHHMVALELNDWLDEHLQGEKPPLGGSTISFDRAWLTRFFPSVIERLHYRNIDVSGIKELCKRWRPDIFDYYKRGVPGEKAHRAVDDIRETLREAMVYREFLFGVGRNDMEPYITGTGQMLRVHRRFDCDSARPCIIHSASDHHMRSMPTHWRSDRGIMERICPHGVGHPDPDEINPDTVHGCDGCCNPDHNRIEELTATLAEVREQITKEALENRPGGFKP